MNESTVRNGPIRTAIIGFGTSGYVFHAPLIHADENYSLDAIVTGNPKRQSLAARSFPGAKIMSTVDELYANCDAYDLVILGSPPATHFSLAQKAIACGLHVVVDKPFVPTAAQGEVLAAQAAEAGVVLTVFQNRRWDGDFLTVKQLLQEDALGEVQRFESRFEWWKPQENKSWKAHASADQGGGILFDLGPHLIDQTIQLFGPVTDVYGELARHRQDGGADDDAFVSMLHETGVRSNLWMNGLAAQVGPRFHILGSTSAFTKWGLDSQEDLLKQGGSPRDIGYGVEASKAWGVLGIDGDLSPVPTAAGNYPEFYHLLAHTLQRGAPAPVDPAEAIEVLRIIEQIHGAAMPAPKV